MDWGLKNRIAKIINPQNNRALMLAVDHGYFLGPTEKLENPKKTIAPLLKYCDSLMLTRGVQRTSVNPNTSVPNGVTCIWRFKHNWRGSISRTNYSYFERGNSIKRKCSCNVYVCRALNMKIKLLLI